ncbi:hypothetical protein HMPREF9166_1376 [Selenomonas sp. oral taxon 149 str. 67H29BP]|nr:hypothetical protein HMPREF9166_1376 [Selenomonas sp. oral taxon 149 str. 67H29BP]
MGPLHEVANFVQQPLLCAPSTAYAVPLPRDNGEGLGYLYISFPVCGGGLEARQLSLLRRSGGGGTRSVPEGAPLSRVTFRQ